MRRIAIATVFMTLAAVVARAWLVYPELPDTVASHFGFRGRADGWSSKQSFFTLMGAVLGLFGALGVGLPLLVGTIPSGLVNLPHREHWLAPERLSETRIALQVFLAWFVAGTIGFIGLVLELTYRANLRAADVGQAVLGPGSMVGLVGYLCFTGLWLMLLFRRFRRPPPRS